MTYIIPLLLGNIALDLVLKDSQLDEALHQRYSEFTRPSGVGYPIIIRWQKSNDPMPLGKERIEFSSFEANLFSEGCTGKILLDQQAEFEISTHNPISGIDYFLRVVTALLVFQSGGLLFHGAGILHQEKGHIFFGHSGSGKSTVASLSNDDIILNDDLLILTPNEAGWKAYATPFWNPTQVRPNNRSADVHGMYRLVKDQDVFLKSMTDAQAVGELIANTPVVTADIERLPTVLERCQNISQSVPIYWLHFRKDAGFWNVIDGV